MHQRVPSQIIVQEARYRSNTLQRPPKHQILRAIPTIQCHNFASLNPQILHQPIAHASHQLEELAIRVVPALKAEELLVRTLVQGLIAEDVEVGEPFLGHGFGDEPGGGDAVDDEAEVV